LFDRNDHPVVPTCLSAELRAQRLLRPFRRDAVFCDVALLAIGIALLGCGDNRGGDDLAAPSNPGAKNPAAESAAS